MLRDKRREEKPAPLCCFSTGPVLSRVEELWTLFLSRQSESGVVRDSVSKGLGCSLQRPSLDSQEAASTIMTMHKHSYG